MKTYENREEYERDMRSGVDKIAYFPHLCELISENKHLKREITKKERMIRRLLCWLGWHELKYIPLREWEKLLKKGHKGHLMLKCKHCGKVKK